MSKITLIYSSKEIADQAEKLGTTPADFVAQTLKKNGNYFVSGGAIYDGWEAHTESCNVKKTYNKK